jgi:hypothetical protein
MNVAARSCARGDPLAVHSDIRPFATNGWQLPSAF